MWTLLFTPPRKPTETDVIDVAQRLHAGLGGDGLGDSPHVLGSWRATVWKRKPERATVCDSTETFAGQSQDPTT